MQRPPFVLVHGAWQHAGTWDLVTPRLQARGHRVWTPRLSGLRKDANELDRDVTLDTHIDDVVTLLEREDLTDVILVGHSYAGMIITGVAEAAASRIARLVYIDAFVPRHGDSALQLLPEGFREVFREQARAHGGWRLPCGPSQLEVWGLEAGPARDFVEERQCDFTIRCFDQPLHAPTHAAEHLDRTYVACVKESYPARIAFERFADQARQENWLQAELPTGHDCHVEMPDEVTELLIEVASVT